MRVEESQVKSKGNEGESFFIKSIEEKLKEDDFTACNDLLRTYVKSKDAVFTLASVPTIISLYQKFRPQGDEEFGVLLGKALNTIGVEGINAVTKTINDEENDLGLAGLFLVSFAALRGHSLQEELHFEIAHHQAGEGTLPLEMNPENLAMLSALSVGYKNCLVHLAEKYRDTIGSPDEDEDLMYIRECESATRRASARQRQEEPSIVK